MRSTKAPKASSGLDGVVVVDKPDGPTSQQAVSRVKRMLGVRKAGHTGTLDPFATGVLVVCVGRATKLATWLSGADKEYLADVVFGVATDTLDRTGTVTQELDASALERERLEEKLHHFRGEIEQLPPMFSAVHVNGKRLHELAREGKEVERPPRQVIIHELELVSFAHGRAWLRVRCSKGTYIRTLAADLGQALGVGAHVAELRRTASDPFTIEQAVPLDQVGPEDLVGIDDVKLPMPDALLDARDAQGVRHGRPPRIDVEPGLVALRDEDGVLLAVAQSHGDRLEILRGI